MELVQVDSVHAQRAKRLLAGELEVLGAGVPLPTTLRSGHPALGPDDDGVAIAAPRNQSLGEEPFVVSQVVVVETIDVGGVEEGDSGIHRRVDRLNRGCFVGAPRDGERHSSVAYDGDGCCSWAQVSRPHRSIRKRGGPAGRRTLPGPRGAWVPFGAGTVYPRLLLCRGERYVLH